MTRADVKGEKLRKSYIEDEIEVKIEKLGFLTEEAHIGKLIVLETERIT